MKLSKPTFIVSTKADTLTGAIMKSPQIITIWVRSGKYKNKLPLIRSVITYETKSNHDAKDYTRRFVSIFCAPKSHLRLSVLRGISLNQIVQLLNYTKTDSQIKKITHDSERFKSIKTFKTWEGRKKIIYTLVGRSGKLLGIIWFSRKRFKNFEKTMAIRLYPPVRGKGISKKFLQSAFKDFQKRFKNSDLWLRTTKDNLKAMKLYRSFGFKVVSGEKNDNAVIMTYKN